MKEGHVEENKQIIEPKTIEVRPEFPVVKTHIKAGLGTTPYQKTG